MPRIEQLCVDFPAAAFTREGQGPEGRWVPTTANTNWAYTEVYIGGGFSAWYNETSIDVAGFMLEEDTVLIPQAYLIQDPGNYACITADDQYTNFQGLMTVVEIMSTRRLDMYEVATSLFNFGSAPGFPTSTYDKQQIVLGEQRDMVPNLPTYDPVTYAISNSPGLLQLNRQNSFGYAQKIANPRVFCYRMVIPFLTDDGDRFAIPPLRMRMEVAVDKVSQIEYIYSLKRNVELAQ